MAEFILSILPKQAKYPWVIQNAQGVKFIP